MTETLAFTFPEQISNTQRSMFVSCPQKWFYSYCSGYRQKIEKSIDLRAGAAFARGLEVARKSFFDEGLEEDHAIDLGIEALVAEYGEDDMPDHVKCRPNMMGALHAYFVQWPMHSDYLKPFKSEAGSGIEFRFAVPLPVKHPTLDQELLYGGRVDMISEYKGSGTLWVVDEKTGKSLGAQWRKKWTLDGQGTSYVWAAKQHGYPVGGFIIRGTGILKRSFSHEEVMQPRSQYQLDDWYEQLLRDVTRMRDTYTAAVSSLLRHRPDRALDKDACGAYGGCAFLHICGSPDPDRWLEEAIKPTPEHGPVDATDALALFD